MSIGQRIGVTYSGAYRAARDWSKGAQSWRTNAKKWALEFGESVAIMSDDRAVVFTRNGGAVSQRTYQPGEISFFWDGQ